MSYEFLSEMALGTNEKEIDQAVVASGRYESLKHAPWSVRGQVLATGLADENEDYVSALKNGRDREDKKKNLERRQGYPQLVKFAQHTSLAPEWLSLFLPQPAHLNLSPLYSVLFQFDLRLTTPFYSRDDLAFYPIENPLRREWVFGAPYLSAAGVKGLLRWAWQMCWADTRMDDEILLFGPRQGDLDEDTGRQGSLYPYPLFWKGTVGLDVINPHSRTTGTGINPIKYEIIKAGGTASLYLLLLNRDKSPDFGRRSLEALEDPLTLLVEQSGLSAKRSTGWGSVDVIARKAWISLPPGQAAAVSTPPPQEDIWAGLTDEEGNLKPVDNEQAFSTAKLAELTGQSKTWVKKNKAEARSRVVEMWNQAHTKPDAPQEQSAEAIVPVIAPYEAATIKDLAKELQKTLTGLKTA